MSVLPINAGMPPPVPVSGVNSTQARDIRRTETDSGIFRRELDSRIKPEGLTFSRHARKRLDMRGITFTPQGLERVENAVARAAEKGSKDALVIAGELALVVSVINNTVVTVMNRDSMEDSIVTNIDSAVFA